MKDPPINLSPSTNNPNKSNRDSQNEESNTNRPLDASKELMLAEYQRIKDAFAENEKDGNTRLNLFITLTTSLMSAFGITKQFENNEYTGTFFFPVLLSLFFIGLFILRRLIHRNIITDIYKHKLDTIRAYFQSYDPKLKEYQIFPSMEPLSHKDRVKQWEKWYSPGTGGYVPISVLLNSIIFSFILIILFSSALIMHINYNENQYKSIKNNITTPSIHTPNITTFIIHKNSDNQLLKSNYYYIVVPLIIILTLVMYYAQYKYVINFYKKQKLNNDINEL